MSFKKSDIWATLWWAVSGDKEAPSVEKIAKGFEYAEKPSHHTINWLFNRLGQGLSDVQIYGILEWQPDIEYRKYSVVSYKGRLYMSKVYPNKNHQPDHPDSFDEWKDIMGGKTRNLTWDTRLDYEKDALTVYNGHIYLSKKQPNKGNQPDTAHDFWKDMGGIGQSLTWKDYINYEKEALAVYNKRLYISLQTPNLNKKPSTSPAFWMDVLKSGKRESLLWDKTVSYDKDSVVVYNGNMYISKIPNNLNHIPTDEAFWTPVNKSLIKMRLAGDVLYITNDGTNP